MRRFTYLLQITIFSVEGKTLLDKVSHMHSITEDDVAGFIKQICEILNEWHGKNVVHLDLRVSIFYTTCRLWLRQTGQPW